jgi:hypothetical protein
MIVERLTGALVEGLDAPLTTSAADTPG